MPTLVQQAPRGARFIGQDDAANVSRRRLAALLSRQGLQSGPVLTPLEGFGRLAQALTGAFLEKRGADSEDKRRAEASKALSDALLQSQRAKPFRDPDDPSGRVMPGTGRSDVLARMLANNPDTTGLAAQIQLGQFERADDLDRQQRLLRERARLAAEGQPPAFPPTREIKRADQIVTQQLGPGGEIQTIGEAPRFQPPASKLLSQEEFDQQVALRNAGKANTDIRISTGRLPKPPSGFAYRLDDEGEIKINERGEPELFAIPGGKEAAALTAAEAAGVEKRTALERSGGIVLQDVDRSLALADKIGTTGFLGSFTQGLPGSPGFNLKTKLDTIKANVGFDRLQQMREASPTGGALGQVSERENILLQSVLGSLDQAQGKEDFVFNLKRLRNTYLDIIHGPGNGPARSELRLPGQPATGKPVGEMTDQELLDLLGSE